MKTCAFVTLGCKVNQYETQAIRESLAAKGFVEVAPDKAADMYIINTCTVTSVSDEKSRKYIRKITRENPDAVVVVTGCYAEANTEVIRKMEGVDYVITKGEEARLAEIVCGDASTQDFMHLSEDTIDEKNTIYDLTISNFNGHTKAFLKIEDGCDMYCSYCIIPYVRGTIRSRKPKDILEEAKRLIQNGYREIILTGIHLGAYGRDVGEKYNLLDIVSMLECLDGLERLRLSSIEVNEITPDFIDLIAKSKKICPHFHIPLQSGDDFILKRMNRTYTSSQYLAVLKSIHSKIEYPSFTTDVIVGFPGEGDVHFENTIKVCESAGFSRIHIFPFSPREGTPAAKMSGYCHPTVIKRRKSVLEEMANILALSYKKQFLNKSVNVLVETERNSRTGKLCGYSERYIKVIFDGPEAVKNKIVPLIINKITPSFATGVLI